MGTKKSFKNKKESSSLRTIMKKVNLINLALSHSVDEGHMALHLAAATRREKTGWSDDVKEKIIEELLFEIDDGDVQEDVLLSSTDDDDEEEDEEEDSKEEDDEDDDDTISDADNEYNT